MIIYICELCQASGPDVKLGCLSDLCGTTVKREVCDRCCKEGKQIAREAWEAWYQKKLADRNRGRS